jgi:RNA methyltransferase, TrmH family
MKKISSSYNDEIKAIKKLTTTKGRKEQRRYIAEGFRVCSTIIAAGHKPIQIYTTEALLSKARELSSDQYITLIDESILVKISTSKSPSGLLVIFRIPQPPTPEKLGPGIVLYDVADPGNTGTLLRSCAAMGKKTVVIIEGADPWSPKVVQASAGTMVNLDIFEWSWLELIEHKKHLKLCALVVEGGGRPDNFDFFDILLIVGNEAHGIPDQLLGQCDRLLTLEMPGHIESLNVAVAGSIALYLAWYKC